MNKTLKTVLITLGVTFVFLFAVVMIFGEDKTAPVPQSLQESEIIPADASMNQGGSTPIEADGVSGSSAEKLSQEKYAATLAYDIFDWNMADEQGKVDIAEAIISVWAANGNSYEQTAKELVTYINQNLYDQANIFEIACVAAQIDPQPYFERIN